MTDPLLGSISGLPPVSRQARDASEEEFLIVLPRTGIHEAASFAERVRSAVGEAETGDLPVRVTASFGVAVSFAGESMYDLIGRADKALYRAKALGRNRVVTQD